MSTSAQSYYSSAAAQSTKMRAESPEIVGGFSTFYQRVMKAAELSVRDKELIAVAIGMAVRCENCIYAHVRGATKAGASRGQIIEAAGVAVMMQV